MSAVYFWSLRDDGYSQFVYLYKQVERSLMSIKLQPVARRLVKRFYPTEEYVSGSVEPINYLPTITFRPTTRGKGCIKYITSVDGRAGMFGEFRTDWEYTDDVSEVFMDMLRDSIAAFNLWLQA